MPPTSRGEGEYLYFRVIIHKEEESHEGASVLSLIHISIRDVPSARDAVTTFRVLERFEHGSRDDGYTLIDCKLFTGRTHQIRVHMEYAKHPLVGEPVYLSLIHICPAPARLAPPLPGSRPAPAVRSVTS